MQILSIEKKHLKKFSPVVMRELKKRGLTLEFNPKDLTVEFESEDPFIELKGKDVLTALGTGGVPYREALRLFSDELVLKVIDISEVVGDKERDVHRVLARIIGTDGKTKKIIEQITEVCMTVQEGRIYLIGTIEGVSLASDAIDALVRGAPHKKVYRLLEAGRRKVREEKMKLWK
ncbi:MAG: RNA-processing protein [Candidatus Micrarchaeia archaeon]